MALLTIMSVYAPLDREIDIIVSSAKETFLFKK